MLDYLVAGNLSAVRKKSERVPAFSHEKHYILLSELRYLYVAVIRAQWNIWICDKNTECSMPFQIYWKWWRGVDREVEVDREEDRGEDQKEDSREDHKENRREDREEN